MLRRRHPGTTVMPSRLVRPPMVHQLGPEPERTAIERPREFHLHLHGADPAEVADILRSAREDH